MRGLREASWEDCRVYERAKMKFEWDEAKNRTNLLKHGISFEQAVYAFADPYGLNIPDYEHSESEERWLLLGAIQSGKIVLVVHTARISNSIRIISARKATANEQKTYNQRSTK